MNFGGRTREEDSAKIIDRAIEAGINFLDTANVYNNGRSEEAVGAALKANGKRDKIVLATKVHGSMNDADPNARGNHRRHIIQQCEASLKRLGTDWIDLYQIHRPDSSVPIDETLRALDDLIRAGKVRYIGTSTYAAWQVVESLWVARELGLNRFVTEQPPYHILDRRVERELLPMAETFGFGVIPWSPLAGGFLTGKYKRGEKQPEESRLGPDGMHSDLFVDEVFDVVESLDEYLKDRDCTMSQFAVAWCLDHPAVTSPIIGPRTMDQLEDNLKALNVEITDDDRAKVDDLVKPGTHKAAYYRADFGPHRHRLL
jgi:aryl-alcohol dehydrogenase-like predicted oxidoreductase